MLFIPPKCDENVWIWIQTYSFFSNNIITLYIKTCMCSTVFYRGEFN